MSTGSSTPSFPNFPPQFPSVPGMPGGSSFPYPQGTGEGTPTTPPVDYSDFDFSSLDLPQWGGGYSAPLTGGQIDSLRGFDVLARNNPLAQTLNQMGQQGANIQDLGAAFKPYGAGYGTLQRLAGGGQMQASGGQMQPSGGQMYNTMSAPNGMERFQPPPTIYNPGYQPPPTQNGGGEYTGGMPRYSDMYNVNSQAQQIASGQGNPTSNFGIPQNMLASGQNWLQQGAGAANAQADVGGITNFIQGSLNGMPTMNQSFDMSQYAQNAGQVFQDQLNQQMSGIREETSGLGLNPGSSDRMDRLGRAAGSATSQFNLGMQDQARQNFENMQGRNLATQQQQISTLPTYLQAQGLNPQLQQQAAQLLTGAAGQQGSLAGQYGSMIGQNTAERQQGVQNSMQMLTFMAQLQSLPFEQQMQAYNNIFNPQSGRQLQAGTALAGLDANAIQQAMAGLSQQGNMLGQNYGLGEAARGTADQDLTRAIAEFQRTQGGTFNQALGLMGQIPGMNTGFGPSGMSQWGQAAAGAAGLAGGIADIYNMFKGR